MTDELVKHYISLLKKEGIDIEPITNTHRDKNLFSFFFEKFERENWYANSWFYLTQAANGYSHGHLLGFKYKKEEDDALFTIGLFERPHKGTVHFHIVNPLGNEQDVEDGLIELSEKIYKVSKTAVFIKKINGDTVDKLILANKNFRKISWKEPLGYAWHKDAPLEDDTWPEVVIDIKKALLLRKTTGKRPGRQYKDFRKKNFRLRWDRFGKNRERDAKLIEDAEHIVRDFFNQKGIIENSSISVPTDYYNMIETAPQSECIKTTAYINDMPVAFLCLEKIDSRSYGLYANLALTKTNENWQNLSYAVIFKALTTILAMSKLKKMNVQYLNLGGSETISLHTFKVQFLSYDKEKYNVEIAANKKNETSIARNSFWLVYDESKKTDD